MHRSVLALASYQPNVAYRGVEKTPPQSTVPGLPQGLRSRPALQARTALGLAIKKLRKRADLTQEQAAANMDVVVQSWRRYEWGDRDLSLDKIDAVAAAIGATREELLAEQAALLHGPESVQVISLPHGLRDPVSQSGPALSTLPIRDRVQAGAWLAADDYVQEGQFAPVVRDPRFPRAEQWCCAVVGDSLNRLGILEGDLVQVVDAIAISYFPQTGDVVEVERLRFGGQERELSLKQVEVTPSGVLLWPRSTNPRWQEPLPLSYGLMETESEVEVRIRARMLNLIRRF